MKIGRNDQQQQPIAQRRTEGAGAGQGVRGPDPRSNAVAAQRARGVGSEAVKLSSLGRQLAAARGPEVPDEARIERLRGLVMSGKLPIDTGAITDAILREER
jgi:flagellar biosynthesis anti-sigma factor FlgM